MLKLLCFATVLLASVASHATFLPVDLQEEAQAELTDANITEQEFKDILQRIQKHYAPKAKLHGGNLKVSGSWKGNKLNAGARQIFGFWQVNITGALARRPELTKDGFTMIVCHELGHHLGGYAFAPADMPIGGVWAASEGQADYFASQVCARSLWSSETEINSQSRSKVNRIAKQMCNEAWNKVDEQNLCYRIMNASESMTTTMANLMKKPAPSFETPDTDVVAQTISTHPKVQCRFDTSVQGSLCTATFNENVIPGKTTSGGKFGVEAEREAAANSCMKYSNYSMGLRPSCWFKPQL